MTTRGATAHPAQRRLLAVLLLAQLLSGAGLSAGVTVGALLAQDILGDAGLSGLPSALLTAGSALAAVLVGRLSQRRGRRPGLAAGFGAGALGAVGVVVGTQLHSIALVGVAFVVYGAGTASNLQARYAGADLALPERKAQSLSWVLLGTTAGAVVGPNLTAPTGRLAASLDLVPLTGPFLLAAAAYGSAALVLTLLLRPDPLVEARRLAADGPADGGSPDSGPAATVWTREVLTGVAVMALTQFVMVALMTMTPVHLRGHGHTVTVVGVVISLHIAAMFLPSPLSGRLVDAVGPRAVTLSAGGVLVASAALAATAPARSHTTVAVALVLLGLGWSLGLVAGTTVLTTAVPAEVRATVQGRADVAVALAGAAGGIGSGALFGAIDYRGLAIVMGLASLPLVAVVGLRRGAR